MIESSQPPFCQADVTISAGRNFDLFGHVVKDKKNLSDWFIVPPFSVLNVGSDVWQTRKKIWMNRIKDTAQARSNVLRNYTQVGVDFMNIKGDTTSILDPVLCEILLHWFSEEGHKTFDPFAGDTVFGFCSAYKGRPFKGIELREEQVLQNQTIIDANGLDAEYILDDALNIKNHIKKETMDFMFSCPPYADLEVYSDKENDLSNMDYDVFFDVIKKVYTDCFDCLKKERFAVITIGEVRHKDTGCYIGLVPKIIQIMCDAGFHYYNEIILNTPVGNLMMRAGRYMNQNRKIGKNHQNVLVFYKGNPNNIKKHFKKLKDEGRNI
jgi:DNA modification methylase